MKTNTRFWFSPLLIGLVIAMLSLVGCSGDDGAPGAAGANGVDGADGADAIILADVLPINPILDLSNTISYDQVAGTVTIHFFLTDEDDNGLDITQAGYTADGWEIRVYATELIDNNDGTAGQSWTPLWNERGYPGAADPADRLPGTLTLVDAATGEYTYVCDNTLANSLNVQRVIMRARWRERINGSYVVFANPVNSSYDFLQSDPANELASSGADMVLTENCETCHGARIGDVGHGGGYTEVKTCNNCHNINYMGPRNGGEGDLAFMVHRIHDAGDFLELDHGGPISFAELTYPQHINTCAKCHGGAPEGNLSLEIMTGANCQSCHEDVDANAGTNHPAGAHLDSECTTCHTNGIVGSLPDIVTAHNPAPPAADTPEYVVTITLDPDPANGTHYVAGEAPQVVVTLAGTVAANYTANQDTAGTSDGNLSSANLFVYGPRSGAVPVLTTSSTTDGGSQQGHPLFLANTAGTPTTDGRVATNATAYRYNLQDVGLVESGTYMIRFEGRDYGAVTGSDYVTASSAVTTFQVGTATEEHKLSGDACTNCHGDTVMHLQGTYAHYQTFDTDGCLACHDQSGNYAEYIGNRVHAVHSASATGDLHNREWTHVTFPQEPNNCTICHTDTNAETPVWRNPNEVACGGCHGTDPLADPADFPDADPNRIIAEAAAAVHMTNEGGTFDVTTLDVPRACIVCHGEGKTADLYDTHHLITFPPPVVPDP